MTNENPWLVTCVQDFWFLRCPECTFDTKEEYIFQDHAVENHPASFALFGKTVKEEIIDNNFEIEEHDPSDFAENYYNNDNSSENVSFPLIPPIVQIKEELLEANSVDPDFIPTNNKLFPSSPSKQVFKG